VSSSIVARGEAGVDGSRGRWSWWPNKGPSSVGYWKQARRRDESVSDQTGGRELGSETRRGYVHRRPGANVDHRRLYSMARARRRLKYQSGGWSRGNGANGKTCREMCGHPGGTIARRSSLPRVETWRGEARPRRRGQGRPADAAAAAAGSHVTSRRWMAGGAAVRLDRYDSPNGELAERGGGCAVGTRSSRTARGARIPGRWCAPAVGSAT